MELTYENLLSRLVDAVPEFPIDADHVADNLVYLTFNDLTRFVSTRLEAEENTELLTRIFQFIEEAAKTGDVQVQDVLQDALYEIAVAPVDTTNKAKMYMGSRTHKLFRKLEAQIYPR
jgi:hypothetical protein